MSNKSSNSSEASFDFLYDIAKDTGNLQNTDMYSSSDDSNISISSHNSEINPFEQLVYQGNQAQPKSPFIPEDWKDYFNAQVDHNPRIRCQGDLELNLYRNYHGETINWNGIELNLQRVIINDLESSITIYTGHDLDYLLHNTSDAQYCEACKLPKGHQYPNIHSVPEPTSSFWAKVEEPDDNLTKTIRPALLRTYSTPTLLKIGEKILASQKDQPPAFNKPPYNPPKSSYAIPQYYPGEHPPYEDIPRVLGLVTFIEKLYQEKPQAFADFIQTVQVRKDLPYIIYFFEQCTIRDKLVEEHHLTTQQVLERGPNWAYLEAQTELVEERLAQIDSDGDKTIEEATDQSVHLHIQISEPRERVVIRNTYNHFHLSTPDHSQAIRDIHSSGHTSIPPSYTIDPNTSTSTSTQSTSDSTTEYPHYIQQLIKDIFGEDSDEESSEEDYIPTPEEERYLEVFKYA